MKFDFSSLAAMSSETESPCLKDYLISLPVAHAAVAKTEDRKQTTANIIHRNTNIFEECQIGLANMVSVPFNQ